MKTLENAKYLIVDALPGDQEHMFSKLIIGGKTRFLRIRLRAVSTPVVITSSLKRSYKPGDTLHIEVNAQRFHKDIYELRSLEGEISLQYDTMTMQHYSGNIKPDIWAGDYKLYWYNKMNREKTTESLFSGITVTVNEFRKTAAIKNILSFDRNMYNNGGIIEKNHLTNFSIKMISDSMKLKGPQFLLLRISKINEDSVDIVLKEKRLLTFDWEDERGKGQAYQSYLQRAMGFDDKSAEAQQSIEPFRNIKLDGWSKYAVDIMPDPDRVSSKDESNYERLVYTVRGNYIKAGFKIGAPLYQAVLNSEPYEQDSLTYSFGPASAILTLAYQNTKVFPISLGLGVLPITIEKKGESGQASGVGLYVSASGDFIQALRYWFDIEGMPKAAVFSLDIGLYIPLKVEGVWKNLPVNPTRGKLLFGVTTGVAF